MSQDMAIEKDPQVARAELVELERGDVHGPLWLRKRLELVQDVKVKLDAYIGSARISVRELFALKEGEVLSLDRMPDEPIEIEVDGKPVARGELVVVGDTLGIRITEIHRS